MKINPKSSITLRTPRLGASAIKRRVIILAAAIVAGFAFASWADVELKTGRVETSREYPAGWEGPVIVEWDEGVRPGKLRAALERRGVAIHGFLSGGAFLAVVPHGAGPLPGELDGVKVSYAPYLPRYKLPQVAARGDAEYLIVIFDPSRIGETAKKISSIDGARIIYSTGEIIRARLRGEALHAVAALDEVVYVDLSVVANNRFMSDVSARPDAMATTLVWDKCALTGKGQTVAVADTGLSTGDFATIHEDLRGRVTRAYAIGRPGDWSDKLNHGTHICGSVAGDGTLSRGAVRGPAWEADIIIQSLAGPDGEEIRPTDVARLFLQAYTNEGAVAGARIHCDSWGAGRGEGANGAELLGVYIEDCRRIDAFVFEHPDFLPVFAAGNDACDADGDGVTDPCSLNSQASAKNALVVGGAECRRGKAPTYGEIAPERFPADPIFSDSIASAPTGRVGMAAFSGRGPCADGRIKPDIVAPATMILAAKSIGDSPYHFKNGTSMAAPLVAGAAALVREYLVERRNIANPDAATIKALLLAGAFSLAPGQYGDGDKREIPPMVPNCVEGWGMANVARSTGASGEKIAIFDAQVIADGECREFVIPANEGAKLDIVMAYADAPAELSSARQLVNDLDLEIVSPSGAVLTPNSLSALDRLDNVEGVRINAAEKGDYTVRVRAHAIAQPMAPELVGGIRNAIRFSLVLVVGG